MNKGDYPLFTVIIPQKNREEYIGPTLKSCMIQDYPNFEIIVSDDCSDDNSVKVAQELAARDSRIKVFPHEHHLGMRDNFEFALNQVRPGYVMALGGDDGLTPGCIWRMYQIIKETGLQLLTWTPAAFRYPEEDGGRNMLRVTRKHAPVKIMKSKDYLTKISRTFNYMVDDCPMFYVKGVASTELVERVKSRTRDHCFYYCPTPDGFSGVVLCGEVEEYAMSFEPLSIQGGSRKSQGRNYHHNDEKSKFEAQQFFNDNIQRTMHEQLASQPYSPLVTLMTADYLLTAKDLPGWPAKDVYEISYEQLIRKTFEFISSSLFTNETLVRELQILKKVAEQHNLLPLFEELYKTTKKKVYKQRVVYGLTYTHAIRFDGEEIGINDVFEASFAVPFIYNFICRFKFIQFFEMFKNSLKVLANTRRYTLIDLPQI